MRAVRSWIPVLFVLTALTLTLPIVRGSTVFYNRTFTLPGANGESKTCEWNHNYVYNSAGSTVTGSITVSAGGKIDFFILNEAQWAQFTSVRSKKGSTCGAIRPTQSEVAVLGLTNYSVSYVVPDNGNHTFLYLNSYMDDATVTVTLRWS